MQIEGGVVRERDAGRQRCGGGLCGGPVPAGSGCDVRKRDNAKSGVRRRTDGSISVRLS